MCRSRRELSNEYLLAKFGFDTTAAAAAAENEPCKVCPLSAYISPRCIYGLQSYPLKGMENADCRLLLQRIADAFELSTSDMDCVAIGSAMFGLKGFKQRGDTTPESNIGKPEAQACLEALAKKIESSPAVLDSQGFLNAFSGVKVLR